MPPSPPPEVTHGFVQANGVRLHYVEMGAGPAVLLLHGFPESWWSWRCQIAPLALAGYRIIAPDLRGYAQSDVRPPYDIDTLARDVFELLQELAVPEAFIVGHDWGGALAWHFVGAYPSMARGIAVLNAPHPGPLQRALRGGDIRQMFRSAYMFFFMIPGLPEWLLTRNDAAAVARVYRHHVHPTHFTPAEVRPFRDAMQRPGSAQATIGYYRAAITRAFRDAQAFQRLPQIHVPALVIWGVQDPWLRFEALVPPTTAWVPELRVVRIDDAGHFVHCDTPDRVNATLLAFFADCPSHRGKRLGATDDTG